MQVFLVSKKSQEESTAGVLLAAEMMVYGIYTDEDMANAMADKYDAEVNSFYLDREGSSRVHRWINPGYVSS